MEKLEAGHPDTQSEDIVAENIDRLRELFPEAFTEGQVDFEVLRELLGDAVETGDEKYGLTWHGKRKARRLALTPSTGTLRPAPEESVDWDTTQNLMIEGDNLEVLKLLQKSYAGKVKLIYIDPPYNTGSDFVYPDDFRDNIKNYLELVGQVDGEGKKVSSNTDAGGRFHTTWLSMMYPRLKLARGLLRPDGVLFVTIDDGEVAQLKLLLCEVFGEENFVASVAWQKRSSPDARDTIGSVHDWLLCFVRDAQHVKDAIGKMPLSPKRKEAYSNPDGDPRGPWASVDMTGMTGRATKDQYFPVELPSGRTVRPPEGRSWGLVQRTFEELRDDNRIWFGKDGDNVPRIKRFLNESDGQVVPSLWSMKEVGSNDEAKKEVNALMGVPGVFDTPKPRRLIQRIVQIATEPQREDIVLDFFAGSGTTTHAVWAQNAADAGTRRSILVQLPEPLDLERREQRAAAQFCESAGLSLNLAELTKERLRRVRKEIVADGEGEPQDLGFRVFKLDSSNIRPWDPQPEDLEATLFDSVDHLKDDRTEDDILFEVLLKLGLDLTVPIEERSIAGKRVHSIGGGVLFVCLATDIQAEDAETLAMGIVNWRDELEPVGEVSVVFRDSGFESDVAKSNVAAILEQHGVETVRSL
ncbi:MAG: site-specific DNA-methyltransferase [Gemmatimonadota bacterium]